MTQAFCVLFFFFFNDTATTEIYTLSLHDALPISVHPGQGAVRPLQPRQEGRRQALRQARLHHGDRKSTRLNSSHLVISYAVFCLKKKTILKYSSTSIALPYRTHLSHLFTTRLNAT